MSTNSKKVEENSYEDSGFQSGFQESSEISREYTPVDNKADEMSQKREIPRDSDNFSDSGIIDREPQVAEKTFVATYLNSNFRRPQQHPDVDKYFQQDEDGYTKLHIAVMKDLTQAIDILTKVVPDASYLNIRNFYGQTPLHLAVLEDQPETVRKLINAGAAVNIRDNRCNTPLHLAVARGLFRCAEVIVSAVDNKGQLLANLEQWSFEGETCFYLASKARNLHLMRLLVANGADINAREGRSGYTPLHQAVEAQAIEVIKFLCEECKSLKIDTENYAGLTSFQVSLLMDQEAMAGYLVTKGATPFLTTDDSDMDDDMDDSSDEMEKNQLERRIAEIAVN
jgi:ankyrin repeat protein